jgi:hypothetical protein
MVSQSQLCFARLLVSPSLRGKTQARFSTFDDKKRVIIPAP